MTHEQLMGMPKDQLMGMINTAELHIREKGPIAFGGYFLWYHRLPWLPRIFRCDYQYHYADHDTERMYLTERGHYLMIEKAGLYWHFVDLVWVFVFLCFYLI